MSLAVVPRARLAPGVEIPRLINGAWQLSAGHRLGSPPQAPDLEPLVHLGLSCFDCADIYTGVEEKLGDLRRRLESEGGPAIRVHTKCVPDLDQLPGLTRRDLELLIARSRARLGVERLDLVQFHWWDFAVHRWVEAATWLAELGQRGEIAQLGLTNFDAEHLAPLLDAGLPLVSNQVQYSLLDRRPARGTAELCATHGLVLLTYGALAGGFLTDTWLGRPDPGLEVENRSLVKYRLIIDEYGDWAAFQRLLGVLRQIANRHSVSIAAVALRWVLDQPGVAAAIVGAGSPARASENLRCFAFELDERDHAGLAEELEAHPGPPGGVYSVERLAGGRHAAIMRTGLNRGAR